MTAKQYRRALDRVAMPDRFRQELVETMTAPKQEEKPVKKCILRTVLLAAVVCATLTATALATSSTLRQALATALGAFQPYSQKVEGLSVTDRGIRIKVVSALMDEVDGTAYVEVTDLTGDRLGMDMELWEGRRRLRPTAYDPETKTALFTVPLGRAFNELKMGRAEALDLSFHSLRPECLKLPDEEVVTELPDGTSYAWWKGVDLPKELYTARTLSTRSLTEEEKADNYSNYADLPVLISGQTPAELDSEYFSLSSAGFDAEGCYHIQLAMAEGVSLYGPNDLDIDICPGVLLEDVGLDGLSYRQVVLKGGKYLDVTFLELTPEILERLPDGTITGQVCTAPAIEGTWDLSLPYQPLTAITVDLDQPFFRQGLDLIDARLSAMSFQLTYTQTDTRTYLGGQPVHLFCKDGTILQLKFNDQTLLYRNADGEIASNYDLTYEQHQGADGWREYAERDSWKLPQAVDPTNVAGFSFGLWYVPLDGSGTGCWLSQPPQATVE